MIDGKNSKASLGMASAQWLTLKEFARLMGRKEITVWTWIGTETLYDFGFHIYQVNRGHHNCKYFILTPPNL